MFEFSIDTDAIERAQKMLYNTPKLFNMAMNNTLRDVLSGIKQDAVGAASENYYLKPNAIKRTLKATRSKNAIRIISRGKRLNLADYEINPRKPLKHRYNLYGAVKKAGGLKQIKRGFLMQFRSGKTMAYKRTGLKRWDIEAITAPAIPQILDNPDVIERIKNNAAEKFSSELNHQALRLLGVYSR